LTGKISKSMFLVVFISFTIVACITSYPPATFIQTFDEPGMWKSVEIKDGMEKEVTWRTIVDALTHHYDLEVIDKDSGYLRTSWKYTYIQEGIVNQNYRSRIVLKFVGDDWKVLQVKCESNWLSSGGLGEPSGWILGYDSKLLEDVYGDIQGRVGRTRR